VFQLQEKAKPAWQSPFFNLKNAIGAKIASVTFFFLGL